MTAHSAADRAFHAAFAALAAGRVEDGTRAMEPLAAEGHLEAMHELARLHLYRMHPDPDAAAGRRLLDAAADAGHPGARHTRAVVTAGAAEGRWMEDLEAAALAGHPLAWRSLGVLFAASRDPALAGWATAALVLASGRDPVAGLLRAHRERCGAPSVALPASQEAVAAWWSAAPRPRWDDVARMPTPLDASEPWRLEEGMLSPDEAALVQAVAAPGLAPSRAIDPHAGTGRALPIRTSDDAPIDPLQEDVAMRLLQRRLCALAGLPAANAEPMVVLRYRPGQEYRLHRDVLPPSTLADPVQGRGGQRAATVVAYLNAVDEGGETEFPRRGLRIAPRPGAALAFRNVLADGTTDEDSLHAGLPVRRGEKWIATLWIREGAVRGF